MKEGGRLPPGPGGTFHSSLTTADIDLRVPFRDQISPGTVEVNQAMQDIIFGTSAEMSRTSAFQITTKQITKRQIMSFGPGSMKQSVFMARGKQQKIGGFRTVQRILQIRGRFPDTGGFSLGLGNQGFQQAELRSIGVHEYGSGIAAFGNEITNTGLNG